MSLPSIDVRKHFGRAGRLLIGTALGLSLSAPVAIAQDASPTADVPTADECTVEQADLSSLLSTTVGADPTSPLFTTEPVEESDLPEGPEATEEELEGITETVRQLVACANAFDPFRILSLISPDYTGQLASAALAAQQQPELAQQLLLRFPVPLGAVVGGGPVEMIPIRDARLLPDGRVGAILESSIQLEDGSDADAVFYVAFVEEDGLWLVDEVLPVASEVFGGPATATPEAGN